MIFITFHIIFTIIYLSSSPILYQSQIINFFFLSCLLLIISLNFSLHNLSTTLFTVFIIICLASLSYSLSVISLICFFFFLPTTQLTILIIIYISSSPILYQSYPSYSLYTNQAQRNLPSLSP